MPEMLEGTGCPIADPATPVFAGEVLALVRDSSRRMTAGRSARDRLLREYSAASVVPRYVAFVESCLRG
jgi:hypothetical protein